MKKIIFYTSIIILIVSLTVILIKLIPIKPFYLNDEYYGTSEIKEITIEELNKLTDEEKTFVLLIYQPMCLTSSNFNNIVEKYSETNKIVFYKIPFSKIKDTSLNKKITYYPSLVLYKEGKVKTYLDATKNSDIESFSSQKGFEKWINKYIILKETRNDETSTTSPTSPDTNTNNNKITLEGVTKEDGKVNIYFFWGNGCPHCKEEFKFLNEIEEEYGNMYNLHAYETWYNEEYAQLAKDLGKILDTKVEGVPLTIIGERVFIGFGENLKQDIKDAIKTESKNNFDVYLDKYLN